LAVSAGAASPEELEAMLEDACLLTDASLLTSLFGEDAVLLSRATSQVRGRSAIAEAIIDHVRDGGNYVAAPQLVMQSGPLALVISDEATSVARRDPDGWHYVIRRLDLSCRSAGPAC
jgi:ketosteroid isomerase-like protein